MKKYAMLTSCTDNYTSYMNAFLNSLDFYGMDIDVHIICIEVNEAYLKQVEGTDWSFNLILHRHKFSDFEQFCNKRFQIQKARYIISSKKSRYKEAAEIFNSYEAVCMMDIDMMIVRDLSMFFDLVTNTPYLIGCNERFKWPLNSFKLNGDVLPVTSMMWMLCNAPLFFDPRQNQRFINACYTTANDMEHVVKPNEEPSDIYTMNVAIWLAGKTEDILPLPQYAWVGNHTGYFNYYSRIFIKDGKWWSFTGEPVYIIHGRWDKPDVDILGYKHELQKRYKELQLNEEVEEKFKRDVDTSVKHIRKQFDIYNNNCKLPYLGE